jgi:predicted O-methyltransferase YrrM
MQHNLSRFGLSDRVRVLKSTSEAVLEQRLLPEQLQLSLVFVDGLHTAEGVSIDFELAYPRLTPLGVMVFDDYFETSVRDYSDRIDQLVSGKGLHLIKHETSRLVWCCKQELHV